MEVMDGVRGFHDGAADATPARKAMDSVVSLTFMVVSFSSLPFGVASFGRTE
jgi:hypothetical protein